MESMKHIKITKGYKYKVAERYVVKLPINPKVSYKCKQFELQSDGWLIIEDTYCYDGASGPTIDTANTYRGAAVHDVLYQLMRIGVLPRSFRKNADLTMYMMLKEDGMWEIRAQSWYISLRSFAGKYATAAEIKKIYTYP